MRPLRYFRFADETRQFGLRQFRDLHEQDRRLAPHEFHEDCGIGLEEKLLALGRQREIEPVGVRFVKKPRQGGCDVVHLFAASLDDLTSGLPEARAAMKPDGALRVSWYKKASKIAPDVTEGDVRRLARRTDLVDVKICAVTDIGSGLKLMVRRHLR